MKVETNLSQAKAKVYAFKLNFGFHLKNKVDDVWALVLEVMLQDRWTPPPKDDKVVAGIEDLREPSPPKSEQPHG